MYTRPTLLLDEGKCRANIKKMAQKAKYNAIEFRPHFKTHQSQEVGEWFKEEGVTKITVSSVAMASYFAQSGWNDITIAFPVNILEADDINKLAAKITLNILLESAETAEMLDMVLKAKVNAFVKLNIGNNRAGLEPDNLKAIEKVLDSIASCKNIEFTGFLGHAGNSYGARSNTEILEIHKKSITKMMSVKNHFIDIYPHIILSVGDTPTCATANDFSKVNEFRPGVFVFFDSMQLQIGCCSIEEVAAVITCPIVAIHKEKKEIITYGGSVHLASDVLINSHGEKCFGLVVENTGTGWGNIVNGVYLKKISQEHGVLATTDLFINSVKIGDLVKIIPVHICTASNLYNTYITTEGRKISRFRL